MAVHRYYRLTRTDIGRLYVASLEYRTAAGTANLAIPGNGTAISIGADGGTAASPFDENAATSFLSTTFDPWVTWDFGAGNERDIRFVTLVNPASGDPGHFLVSGKVEYSDNGTTWVPMIAISGRAQTAALSESFTHIPPSGYSDIVSQSAAVQSSGGASSKISSPQALISGAFGGASAATSAKALLQMFGGGNFRQLTLPLFSLYANGHSSDGENAFNFTLGKPSLSAFGGGTAALSGPVSALTITGTVAGQGRAALASPVGMITANGKVSTSASAALRAPLATIIGYSGAVCSITIGKATLQASGTSGSVGGAAITCPLFELTASGSKQNSGKAELLAPSARLGATAQAYLIAPGAQLTAIGTAVVVATYEAYSINLTHKPRGRGVPEAIDEVTRYTNFPFTHIVRYQNSYFGVATDGLYLLEGATDNGAPITYTVRTAVDDFRISEKKILSSAYLAGRIGPTLTTTVYAGETGQNAYNYNTPRGQGAQNHREKFGKGVKDRYFALGLSGTDVLEIDSIEIEDNKLNRRI